MSATDFDVGYVARLARMRLSEEERTRLGSQLEGILAYVDKLREVDVSGVEPMAHPFPMVNVVREDLARPGMENAEALRNAPAQANGLFLVPKIVE